MKNLRITVNGTAYDVQVEELGETASASVPAQAAVSPLQAPAPKSAVPENAEVVCAPMPGNILSCNVKAGDKIKSGSVMFVLEAMKMENEILAPHDACVAAVHVNKGESVESGAALVSLV